MKFSIIVPLIKESSYLNKLLDSIKNQSSSYELEIILVSDINLNIVKEKYNFDIKDLIFEGTPPKKRDFGFDNSNGEIIVFVDDDAYLPKNYFLNLFKLYQNSKFDYCIVGPSLTPNDDNFISKVSDYFFSSKFLFYFNERNKIIKKSFYVKDWPTVNFTIPRKIFIKVGKFNSDIWPGEDTFLCNKIIKFKYKIKYSGLIFNYHYRRNTLKSLCRQIFRYGLHRGILLKKLSINKSNFIFYFLISILIFLMLFTIVTFNLIFIKLFSLFYLFILFLGLIEMFFLNRNFKIFISLIMSPILHSLYFIGLFKGIFKSFSNNHISKLGR